MKKNSAQVPATDLPIYERAVKRFPHLAHIRDAKHFCAALGRLAAVEEITAQEYYKIAMVASGYMWPEVTP